MIRSLLTKKSSIQKKYFVLKYLIMFSVLFFPHSNAFCQEIENFDLPSIIRGGKLYDNWLAFVPKEKQHLISKVRKSHPSYPKNSKQNGITTWRCKECHGWDYKGVSGAYKTGSHYTGIIGIDKYTGRKTDEVMQILRDSTHKISGDMISQENAKSLAAFVIAGQVEMDDYFKPGTSKIDGNANRGKPFFQTLCSSCHGLDGRLINFSVKINEYEFLGSIGKKNVWELIHKIRNGQPDEKMISLRALTLQQQKDIVAYIQTLPDKP
ncbi:MAG: c-type cytochrome [Magnetococcales bacterium]|nr:c-type cytochrome [Magnetococcales bacterium]